MSCQLFCYKHDSNGVSRIEENHILDEVTFFSLIIESDQELNTHILLITDIPINLNFITYTNSKFYYTLEQNSVRQYFNSQNFNTVFDKYTDNFYVSDIVKKIEFYKLFINYPIGICEILLYDKLNEQKVIFFNLNIISSKIDNREFSLLVDYVESRGSSIWASFSLIKHKAQGNAEDDKLEWMIIFCADLIKIFKKRFLSLFAYDKIQALTPVGKIGQYSSDSPISESSLHWLLYNLDILTPTVPYDVDKIIINNRSLVPLEILSENLVETTDLPENQLVHGFISEIYNFINKVILIYENDLKNNTKKTFDDYVKFYAYKRKLKDLNSYKTELELIRFFLVEEIPVKEENLSFLHLNKIEAKEHYYFIYKKALEWITNKDAVYSAENQFFKGVSRLDELFERACYFKLIELFIELEYKIINIGVDSNAIKNKIVFTKGALTHTLYFQKMPEFLTTIKKGRGNLLPDFVIDLDNKNYIIIDAKYKKDRNIIRYDYPDLTLKYLHGIGNNTSNNTNTSAIALLMLYPFKSNNMDFYQKDEYGINSTKPALPLIGSLGINFEDSNEQLKFILKRLINLI